MKHLIIYTCFFIGLNAGAQQLGKLPQPVTKDPLFFDITGMNSDDTVYSNPLDTYRHPVTESLAHPISKVSAVRPTIGLTLSGGGAKGLAHIGILKAIDSAGLKIDYVTGTSMGSILGGLYAIGYSADSIEKMVQKIDWDLIMSNQSSLRSLFMEEKDEYSKYVLELPWMNNRLHFTTGLLTGQELWLKFSELFFPVHKEKDFSAFSIPFRCIATDVGTGEAVVMDKGEIISAIRASMAIPSVFTAVNRDGKKLIDGGLVRNFPVSDVKNMGADIVIGSNVASALLPSEKVRNPLQILFQVAFFREAEDNKKEVPLCDIYIPFDLDKYNMGSFSDARAILELGVKRGRALYPRFKQLADSLDVIYGSGEFIPNRLPETGKVRISSYEIIGTERTSKDFFIHTLSLNTPASYTVEQLSDKIRQAYGTRYYNRITYSLVPQTDGSCKIIFDVTENPFTFVKLGLHYNKFTGIGLIGNITTRNFLITNSRSLVSINLGETFRVRGEHLQYMGRRKDFALLLETQLDRFDLPSYEQYKQGGLYKQNYFRLGGRIQFSSKRRFTVGAGTRFEWRHYSPVINSKIELKGSNNFMTNFLFVSHNTLDKAIYPQRGIRLDAEAGWVAHQHPSIKFLKDGQPATDPSIPAISTSPYPRITLSMDGYTPVSGRATLLVNIQAGANFNYDSNLLNEFVVGGLTRTFQNQILFAGLSEGSFYTPSIFAIRSGLRYQFFNNAYFTGNANMLFNNHISKSAYFTNPDFMSGYSVGFAYNFALGPLEISAMYCDQTRKVQTYINLGIPF